jgi:hypothetical protein
MHFEELFTVGQQVSREDTQNGSSNDICWFNERYLAIKLGIGKFFFLFLQFHFYPFQFLQQKQVHEEFLIALARGYKYITHNYCFFRNLPIVRYSTN